MRFILRSIAGAWTFFWRQPALVRSSLLLVFLPMVATNALDVPFPVERPEQAAVLVVLHLAAVILLTWGTACVLVVGKRLLQAKAGRLRTSFTAVRTQASRLIIPLLLTDILRGCIALLWSIPLILICITAGIVANDRGLGLQAFLEAFPWLPVFVVLAAIPPILYLLQTILAPLVVAYEKISFRPALARSRQLVRGHLGQTILFLIVLCLLWLPSVLAEQLLVSLTNAQVSLFAVPVVSAFFDSFALVLWLLALTHYYKALGGKTKASKND